MKKLINKMYTYTRHINKYNKLNTTNENLKEIKHRRSGKKTPNLLNFASTTYVRYSFVMVKLSRGPLSTKRKFRLGSIEKDYNKHIYNRD